MLGVRDKSPSLRWVLLAIQHVYAMFGTTVGMTRVASVHVIALAAVIAILFAFLGHLTVY